MAPQAVASTRQVGAEHRRGEATQTAEDRLAPGLFQPSLGDPGNRPGVLRGENAVSQAGLCQHNLYLQAGDI